MPCVYRAPCRSSGTMTWGRLAPTPWAPTQAVRASTPPTAPSPPPAPRAPATETPAHPTCTTAPTNPPPISPPWRVRCRRRRSSANTCGSWVKGRRSRPRDACRSSSSACPTPTTSSRKTDQSNDGKRSPRAACLGRNAWRWPRGMLGRRQCSARGARSGTRWTSTRSCSSDWPMGRPKVVSIRRSRLGGRRTPPSQTRWDLARRALAVASRGSPGACQGCRCQTARSSFVACSRTIPRNQKWRHLTGSSRWLAMTRAITAWWMECRLTRRPCQRWKTRSWSESTVTRTWTCREASAICRWPAARRCRHWQRVNRWSASSHSRHSRSAPCLACPPPWGTARQWCPDCPTCPCIPQCTPCSCSTSTVPCSSSLDRDSSSRCQVMRRRQQPAMTNTLTRWPDLLTGVSSGAVCIFLFNCFKLFLFN